MFWPTTLAENASGESWDLFMWRMGSVADCDGDARFGSVEMNSGGESGVLLIVLGDK